MPAKALREFLNKHHVKFVTIAHSKAFTAQEVAASAHIPGKELAKPVVVKIDGAMALVVVPASFKVDLEAVKAAAGARRVELAGEGEFRDRFPECDLGAMPPFGHLYGMATYVADLLATDQEIAFNACTHSELFRLKYADFARLEKPMVGRFVMAR